MRLGHEVIRGGLIEVKELLEAEDLNAAADIWRDLRQWMVIHQEMEEGIGQTTTRGFFWVLDEYGGDQKSRILKETHEELDEIEHDLNHLFKKRKHLHKIYDCFLVFEKAALKHMKTEEGIMMPQIMSLQKQSNINLREIMVTEVMPCIRNENHFMCFAIKMLEKYSYGKPRARVFAQAVWGCSSEFQWKRRLHYLEGTASPKLYKEIVQKWCRDEGQDKR